MIGAVRRYGGPAIRDWAGWLGMVAGLTAVLTALPPCGRTAEADRKSVV